MIYTYVPIAIGTASEDYLFQEIYLLLVFNKSLPPFYHFFIQTCNFFIT